MPQMTNLIENHETLLFWLTIAAIIAFIVSIILIPQIVAKIPSDYFSHPQRQKYLWGDQPKIIRLIFIFVKNILGGIFIIGGIAMLFLPGQGIITIIIGLFMMDFPFKYKVELWIIKQPSVLRSINKLRAKAKQPPLEIIENYL